ncbi:MAG: hypothetical protein AAGA56_13650 [Myxococcota bacterium]
MKHGGPLLGYNNNIPYQGNVYHVQTEDSGTKRPHVFTHLFADGGRIIKTKKTSYAHLLEGDPEDLPDRVRALMKEQHKAMVIALRDGELDHLIDPDGDVDPSERVEVVESPAVSKPPPGDIEVLERAADGADEPIDRKSSPGMAAARISDNPRRGGAYSFVGERDSAPAPESVPPQRRRMRSTGVNLPVDSSPPAVDVAATGPNRSRPPPPRRRASKPSSGFGASVRSGKPLHELMLDFLKRQ